MTNATKSKSSIIPFIHMMLTEEAASIKARLEDLGWSARDTQVRPLAISAPSLLTAWGKSSPLLFRGSLFY
jgi:hypothetical protein